MLTVIIVMSNKFFGNLIKIDLWDTPGNEEKWSGIYLYTLEIFIGGLNTQ